MDRLIGHTRRPKSTARLTEEREEQASQGLLVYLSFLDTKSQLPSPVATAISLATGLLPLLFAMLCDMNAAKSDSLENDEVPGSSTDFLDVYFSNETAEFNGSPIGNRV